MPTCPACHANLDAKALAGGRCARCGATVRSIPTRKLHDARAGETQESQPSAASQAPQELDTLDPNAIEDTRSSQDTAQPAQDTIETMQLPDEGISIEVPQEQETAGDKTIAFAGEQTVDFTGVSLEGASADEASETMVTAQWLDNVAGGESDPGMTIKQKETIESGVVQTRSSLIVKSRQVRPPSEVPAPFSSAADAPDYELLDVIGEGGMGVVYSARQSAIARTVAVKMLKGTDEHTDEQREKFISEAVVTGELDHPNIVPIYDLGSNDSGALFYSMKKVRGTPWDDVLKENSLDENLNILLRVADAIAFAHANGVLHRDLKPENIMLGDYGEVLVMDWGLARISADFPNADAVSQSDVMGGTPAYMAPEMATGPVETITTASDIYLLGAILFEIITGRPPHSGNTVMACLFAAAKNTFVETAVTGELMDIAMRAMATKPADRYATVQEFQAAIRLYQSHSESVLLTENASRNLQAAIESDDYDLYSRSLYGFQEALSLWPGNERAQDLLEKSRGAYAQSALERTDFELGISLLEGHEQHHADLLAQLVAGRNESESRQRRLTWMKRAVAALLLAVIGIISVAYVAVRDQRNEAIAQRDRADENYQKAEAARKVADEQRARAETEKERAERERERAETEKERAEREEARALQQEQIALRAKEAEQYEAYVARIGLANAKIEENAFDRAAELLDQCDPALRQWEWGRLSYLCSLSRHTWQLGGPVEAVAVSADGLHFASGDWDGKVKLWDLTSGSLVITFSHGQYVHAVAFDPRGERLASGSSDHTVRVYDTTTGELLQTLRGHDDAVVSVRFSTDGEQLLTAGFDNTARLWDLASGEVIQVLSGHSWWVWAAEFSPDRQRIVTASQDGKAIVWQQKGSGEYSVLTEFAKHSGPIYAAQFSPDGVSIATAGYDRRVLVWNPDEVQPVDIARRLDDQPDPPAPSRELAVHDGPIRGLAFSPDGSMLVSGGQDNVLKVWDLTSDRVEATLRGHASHVRDCVFTPDGKRVLSAGRDQVVKLWQLDTAEQYVLGGQDGATDAVLAAHFSPDGRQIVTANRDRSATLWSTSERQPVQHFAEGHDFLASSAIFFASGARLATGAGDGTVRLWDVATGTQLLQLDDTGRTAALAVSPDGRLIATGSAHTDVVVWDAESGEQVAVLKAHEAAVTALAFSPDGRTLASGDDLGRCRLWTHDSEDSWSGSHWLRGHSRSVTALEFVDGGNRLISASGDNTCAQWDVASGQELRESVLTHPDWISDMAVSADGTKALTSCDDGMLRLWSLAEARVLSEIESPAEVAFTSVDLSPDARYVMAVSAATGRVHMWDLQSGEELKPDEQAAWLVFGDRAGVVWAARFNPEGTSVLTLGGNDARLWDFATRESLVRFSPHGAVADAALSPDGKLLVTGSWDQSAKIWDVATGQAVHKLDGLHRGYVNSVQFSPDGLTILTASDDATARLWDVATGKPVDPVLRGHASRVRQARFNSTGEQILTTSNDKTARVWDRRTGEVLQTLAGHEWAVLCGEFSSDGTRVITGSEDNTALVWDVSSGEILQRLAGHTDSITAVALAPDGRRAMTASQDGTAKLWDALTGKEILTLLGHAQELTSVSFSPDGRSVLTSSRDGTTILWPTARWQGPVLRQAAR